MATCCGVKEDAGLDGAAEETGGLDSAGLEEEAELFGLEVTGWEDAVLEEDGLEETVLEAWEEASLELSGAEETSLETTLSVSDSKPERLLVSLDSREAAVSDSMLVTLLLSPPQPANTPAAKAVVKSAIIIFFMVSLPLSVLLKQYHLLYFLFFIHFVMDGKKNFMKSFPIVLLLVNPLMIHLQSVISCTKNTIQNK